LPLTVLGGTPVGPFPGGMHCAVQDSDTCTVGPYTAINGYGWGFEGLFIGDLDLVLDTPGFHHEFVCTNIVLVGPLQTDPSNLPLGLVFPDCVHEGTDPPQDLPVTMTCISRGMGVAACSLID
ncbi:MAG: hypothetical protein LC624_03430, partial [Halobacteriales archaeon]|nr:hypothetical protein [Halobacteriales archaeon]